jgi:hypothetical protein
MRVFVKWNDDGEIRQEVTDLINQDQVFVKGTDISISTEILGTDFIFFEDDFGLWGVEKENIIELRQIDIEPSNN